MSTEERSNSGIHLMGMLGIAFIILKLCHVINWSWWWVTVPFWGGFAILLIILLIALIFSLIGSFRK